MKLIVLPGMDGTGELLVPFAGQMEKRGVPTQVISYPHDQVLSYVELTELVYGQLPEDEPFAVLGESFSGPVALALGQRGIPNLKALVLVVTFAEPPRPILLKLTKMLPLKSMLSLPIPCWMAKKVMMGAVSPPGEAEKFCEVIDYVDPGVIAERIREVRELKLEKEAVDLPCIYIQATHDTLLPESAVEGIREWVPQVKVYRVEGAHLVLDTAAGPCAEIVSRFLKRLPG